MTNAAAVETITTECRRTYPRALPYSYTVEPVLRDRTGRGRDAILRPVVPGWSIQARSWNETRDLWRALVDAEQLEDFETRYFRSDTERSPYGLVIRETDGALEFDSVAYALHMHAWRQLIGLLAVGQHERGMAGTFAWQNPPTRSESFSELVSRSARTEGDKPIVFRSHIDPATGLRALRAVLSGVHAGPHFDDTQVLSVIHDRVDGNAPAFVSRQHMHTEGWVALRSTNEEVRATVHFRNSEVGASALKFWSGCIIHVVDAPIRFRGGVEVDANAPLEVNVATASGSSTRRHTLRRKGLSEDQRAALARERIAASFTKANDAAEVLAASWSGARQRFPAGWNGDRGSMDRQTAAAVIIDLLQERAHGRVAAEDFPILQGVMEREERLTALPFGSAAHIAAAYAVAAREATTAEDCARLQELAGDWVLNTLWK